MIWITSDLHLGHKNLVKMGKRPEGFEDRIAENWAKVVRPNDTVICLGDVSMSAHSTMHEKYIKKLPGFKQLVRGNHDNKKDQWYLDHGWNAVSLSMSLDPLDLGLTVPRSWLDNEVSKILLTHKPFLADLTGWLNIHGHLHDDGHRDQEFAPFLGPRHVLIALESNGYTMTRLPDLLDKWESSMKEK